MLAILSPAKALDFDSRAPTAKSSSPEFLDESTQIIQKLRQLAPQDLARLMGISDSLASLNYDRYAAWKPPFTRRNAKQALYAFNGPVYQGLRSEEFTARDLTWAQKHLRILSGLHGLLRPLDLIQPYRLEMGTRLGVEQSQDLYGFWRDQATATINRALAEVRSNTLLNLASQEYFSVLDTAALEARIITPVFKDLKNGRYKFIQYYGKRARGLMAAWLVKTRSRTLKGIRAFDWGGYRYCAAESSSERWVFLRDKPEPTPA